MNYENMKKAIPYIVFILITFSITFCTSESNTHSKDKQKTVESTKLPLCPDCITTLEAAKNIGKIVKVSGVVKKVTLVDWEKGKPCFLDLDQEFPNNVFNVVIFRNNHQKFSDFNKFQGKTVAVTGKVRMHKYKGNDIYPPSEYPEIEIKNVEQIEILD